ncbi:dynein [Boeremia exigua]|uniref:dynein n=1 Tax=Boeremia exigua TaxID=749465 RepID=UPI001E8DD1DB|nr:dynein [Boeremia exigua]KAH6644269.1 dynein [Boeremia exigua]
MASARRTSGFPTRAPASNERPASRDTEREEIWKPMLDNMSSGKRLPEKSLLVLGGTPETQRDFLDAVATDGPSGRRQQDRGKKPPVANQFALGYTYQDVLDTDHEDTLARLSLYLLASPSPAFTPLIRPYLTPRSIPNMLVVVLLDWNHPWLWIRQLRDWIRVLRSLILSLDDASKDVLHDNIATLQDKGRHLGDATAAMDSVKIPLGPGEWDEELGLPLCVVCQNADKIEALEKERGWKEEEFDFILQYLRTILLKHGGSLIYTMPSAPGSLQTLVHSTLGIKSLLKQDQLRHNVTDRDRVLVPPNWDSWAKIRILRGNFEVEEVSQKWSVDIDVPQAQPSVSSHDDAEDAHVLENSSLISADGTDDTDSATAIYEKEIRNPESDFALSTLSKQGNGVEVTSMDPQVFLTEQVHVLDQLRQEDDKDAAQKAARKEADPSARNWTAAVTASEDTSGIVEEHIGPVQFNMGGIHVNADEMVKRLQDREASRSNEPKASTPDASDPSAMSNDKLMSFFSGLINKGANSPARGA